MSASDAVYRIQSAIDGRGPWRHGFSMFWSDPTFFPPDETTLSLVPNLAGLKTKGCWYGCGCRSLEELSRWFSPIERERLAALGYVIARMDVDEIVASGRHQVVFMRRRPLTDEIATFAIGGWSATV